MRRSRAVPACIADAPKQVRGRGVHESFMDEETKTKLTIAWRTAATRLIDAGYEPRGVYATMASVALSGAGGQANDNPPPVVAKPMTKPTDGPFARSIGRRAPPSRHEAPLRLRAVAAIMEGSAKDGAHAPFEVPNLSLKRVVTLTACGPNKACACSHMPVHSTIEAADRPAAEQLLLTIGRAGLLSSWAIAAEELETARPAGEIRVGDAPRPSLRVLRPLCSRAARGR